MKKEKVLFLITSLAMGGAEKYVLSLAKELKQNDKYEPIIVSLQNEGEFIEQALAQDIKIIFIKRYFQYDIFAIFRLLPILKNEQIAIIHSHMLFSNLIARFAGKLAKTPVVISTEHGLSFWKNKLLILVDRWTQNLSDLILTVSDKSRSIRISREKIKPEKIKTIYNFVNSEVFSPLKSTKKTYPNSAGINKLDNKFVLGMMARLTQNKRVDVAIRALKEVIKQYTDVHLVILGNGPEVASLKSFSKSQNMELYVTFAGFQSDIISWLSIFDVFMILSELEDCPISLLEALSMEKPVIATNVGGIPEILEEGQCGFLIPSGDYEILARKIEWLISHKNEAKTMGINGRKRVLEKFSNQVIVPQIVKLYDNLLNNKKI